MDQTTTARPWAATTRSSTGACTTGATTSGWLPRNWNRCLARRPGSPPRGRVLRLGQRPRRRGRALARGASRGHGGNPRPRWPIPWRGRIPQEGELKLRRSAMGRGRAMPLRESSPCSPPGCARATSCTASCVSRTSRPWAGVRRPVRGPPPFDRSSRSRGTPGRGGRVAVVQAGDGAVSIPRQLQATYPAGSRLGPACRGGLIHAGDPAVVHRRAW